MAITLTDIETAITQIQTSGQSFTVDGITYNRANLSSLIELRDKIRLESGRTAGTRPAFRGFQFGSMGYD